MIEAVGWQYFDTYFRRCSELLEPDGLMLLQAITIDDRAYEVEKASKSFINTHIFPGGCLPSLDTIHRCVGAPDRHAHGVAGRHHRALRRDAACAGASRSGPAPSSAAELGYDLRFRRMWELYLAYVEAGFRECRIGDVQMLLAKPEWREPLVALSSAARG